MKIDFKKRIKEIPSRISSLVKNYDWKNFLEISSESLMQNEINLMHAVSTVIFISFFIFSAIIHYAAPENYWNHLLALLIFLEMLFFFRIYSWKIWIRDTEDSKEWFEEIGYKKLAIRYYVIKRRKLDGLDILFITIFMLIVIPYFLEPIFEDEQEIQRVRSVIFSLIWLPFIMILSNLIFRIKFFVRRFSNYYCAKGLLLLINEDKTLEEEQKIRIFKICIEFYNNFLKIAAGFQIKNFDAIYSSIICELKKPIETFYKEFLKTFEKEKSFEPSSYLASILNEDESLKMVSTYSTLNKFNTGSRNILPITLAILAVLNFVFGVGVIYVNELINFIDDYIPKVSFQ